LDGKFGGTAYGHVPGQPKRDHPATVHSADRPDRTPDVSVHRAGTYYNSGLLADLSPGLPVSTSYSLTFPHAGTFTYFCLVHGAMMKGTVHVHAAGAPYPYSQRDYEKQARATTAPVVRDGNALTKSTRRLVDRHTVAMGADDGTAMVMRFIRPTVVVHVGKQVRFENLGMEAPHTVTFGTELANPFSPPSGDPTQFGGGNLNSGIVPANGHFTVTFTMAGTYHYHCALHDYMGMVGKVIVEGVDRHDRPEQ
jgi:plastocyanin